MKQNKDLMANYVKRNLFKWTWKEAAKHENVGNDQFVKNHLVEIHKQMIEKSL